MSHGKNRQLKPKDPIKTIKRLFSYFRYNKIFLFGGILFVFLSSVAQIGANAMLSPIIDTLVGDYHTGTLIKYLIIMGVFVILVALSQYLGDLCMVRLSHRTVHKIREEMFSHMQKLPISFFDTHSHGELMSTFTNDVDMLVQSLEQGVSQVILSAVTLVGTLIMMIILSPILTLIVVGMLFVMFTSIKVIGQRSAKNFRFQQATLADMNGYIEEMMSGQKVVKVFNYEERAIDDFNRRNEELRKSSTLASTFGTLLMPVMGNLSFVLYALVSMIGSVLVMKNKLSVGNIATFLQYTRTISRPITMVSNQFNTLFAALAGAERIFNVLDEEVEVDEGDVRLQKDEDGNQFWIVPKGNGNYDKVPLKGHISFENVSFGYVEGRKVLKNINLYAKPGQKIAFVGSTGAGKTTITNLINRFYEINEGKILYDGIDIKRINKHDLRSTMSIVLQDVHLFEGTIADNIRYGRLDATDEEVIEAAKAVMAHDFITELKDGYHAEVSERGATLSAGQRQLISFARTLLADPKILILDEATSSIDTKTEIALQKGLERLLQGRTSFIIAHRLSTIKNASKIMYIDNGRILEEGTHEELMARKGAYWKLYTEQYKYLHGEGA